MQVSTSPRPDPPRFATRILSGCLHWFLIPGFAVLLVLWPALSSGLQQLLTDEGDTLLNLYFLEHAFQHLGSARIWQPDLYWSPQFFWPIKDTLAWSDHLLGPSLIYGLFRLTLDPFQAYVCWLSSSLCLNYVSIRRACEQIAPDANLLWLSLAALVASFSPTIIQQLTHPQLLSLFLIGPILVHCHRLLTASPADVSLSDWTAAGCWLLANGWFNIYIFVYACYAVLVCTAIHCFKRISSRSIRLQAGRQLAARLLVLALISCLNLIIYAPYLQTLKTFGKRPFDEILANLPKPASWLYSTPDWLLPAPLSGDHVNQAWVQGAEQELFPGWGLIILLVAAVLTAVLRRRQQAELRIWLAALLGMVILSISVQGISLWPLISRLLPGASSLRASSRVGIMIVLSAAPCIALASRQWPLPCRGKRRQGAWLLTFMAGFSAILPIGQPAFSLEQWRAEKQAIAAKVKSSDCDVFWYEWSNQEPYRAQVLAMHVQMSTGIPTANGYSGHFPKDDWPFSKPSGIGALTWIGLSRPGRFHRLHSGDKIKNYCLVKYDQNATASVHKPRLRNRVPEEIYSPSSVQRSLWKQNNLIIAADHQDWLVIRDLSKSQARWMLLLRDGLPMPAVRGDYSITAMTRDAGTILITDTNRIEGVEYQWRIDAESGVFLGQEMRFLK